MCWRGTYIVFEAVLGIGSILAPDCSTVSTADSFEHEIAPADLRQPSGWDFHGA